MEYGSGKYTYTLVEDWAKLPEGESLVDVVGLSIDEDDRVYVFGRARIHLRHISLCFLHLFECPGVGSLGFTFGVLLF